MAKESLQSAENLEVADVYRRRNSEETWDYLL